jgi:hypothetical protein
MAEIVAKRFVRAQRIRDHAQRRRTDRATGPRNASRPPTPAISQRRVHSRCDSIVCPVEFERKVGLAAVATEFNLQLDTLEADLVGAVERGTAALLLAGFGPSLTRHRQSVRAGEQGGRHKLRRSARKARQSQRFPMGKSVISRPLGESVDGRS